MTYAAPEAVTTDAWRGLSASRPAGGAMAGGVMTVGWGAWQTSSS